MLLLLCLKQLFAVIPLSSHSQGDHPEGQPLPAPSGLAVFAAQHPVLFVEGHPGQLLVLVGGLQVVQGHLLVEDGREGARDGRHDPHPVGRAPASLPVLVGEELHEGLGHGVVVDQRHLRLLRAGGTGSVGGKAVRERNLISRREREQSGEREATLPTHLVRMQHRNVDLERSLVLPQRDGRASVQPEFVSHLLRKRKRIITS